MAKLGFEESCGYGLTLPHQMDPLCLSTRTHWVHWLAVLSWASRVSVFFFSALFSHSRVWMLGHQLITLLPISFWAHPTPARPTQLRIALYSDVITGLCCSFSHFPTFFFFFWSYINLFFFFSLFVSCAMMIICEKPSSFNFTVDLQQFVGCFDCCHKKSVLLLYVSYIFMSLW